MRQRRYAGRGSILFALILVMLLTWVVALSLLMGGGRPAHAFALFVPELTNTPTSTETGTSTSTNTSTPTITNTPTRTQTPRPTHTNTNTPTKTPTPPPTRTPTFTRTATHTRIPTRTFTVTPTATNTPTNTPTVPTSTPTNTPGGPTNTPTNTNTPTVTSTPTIVSGIRYFYYIGPSKPTADLPLGTVWYDTTTSPATIRTKVAVTQWRPDGWDPVIVLPRPTATNTPVGTPTSTATP